jgi:hypothetical protein
LLAHPPQAPPLPSIKEFTLPVKPDAATPLAPADPDVPVIGVLISTAKTGEEIRMKLPAIKSGAGFFLKGRFVFFTQAIGSFLYALNIISVRAYPTAR